MNTSTQSSVLVDPVSRHRAFQRILACKKALNALSGHVNQFAGGYRLFPRLSEAQAEISMDIADTALTLGLTELEALQWANNQLIVEGK